MGVVMDINERGQYLVGTKSGILNHRYSRNLLTPCENQFILPEEVPDKEVALRRAVGADSLTGTQGNLKKMTKKFYYRSCSLHVYYGVLIKALCLP